MPNKKVLWRAHITWSPYKKLPKGILKEMIDDVWWEAAYRGRAIGRKPAYSFQRHEEGWGHHVLAGSIFVGKANARRMYKNKQTIQNAQNSKQDRHKARKMVARNTKVLRKSSVKDNNQEV